MIRFAIVTNATSRRNAEAYLPGNYRILWEGEVPAYLGADRSVPGFVITGEDVAGWTLDGYVIPRYASGLIGCRPIDASDPVLDGVCIDCGREFEGHPSRLCASCEQARRYDAASTT